MTPRIGIGYDSHRFADGRPLILAGIEIPHERGLDGHSDADVLLHAVTDAILGALGEGDIGTWFPPSDERWKDADSKQLLGEVLSRTSANVGNVDVTLVCEAPRLGPHRDEMERSLGGLLDGAPASIKATTNEGMGWIGRGEGIAALAVALLV